jgi:hypothetical protein
MREDSVTINVGSQGNSDGAHCQQCAVPPRRSILGVIDSNDALDEGAHEYTAFNIGGLPCQC